MRRGNWILVIAGLAVMAAACRERSASGEAEAASPPPYTAGELPEVEPVAFEVFLREPVEAGPKRQVLHLLVAARASSDQLRDALERALNAEAERDTTLVAIRAVAYVSRPSGPREADVVPVAWGEWLPPEGWDGAGPTRASAQRVYTYIGVVPEW